MVTHSPSIAPQGAVRDRRIDLVVDGRVLSLAYQVAGAGPPLLLLHGLGDSALSWSGVLPALARSHTVYALDLPGFGSSSRPEASYTPDFLSAAVAAFLDALTLPAVAIAGNSPGGLVALRLALESPGRVTALALLDSAGLGRGVGLPLRLLTLPGVGGAVVARNRTPLGAWFWVLGLVAQLFAVPWRAPWPWVGQLYRMARTPGYLEATVAAARAELNLRGQRPEILVRAELPQLQIPTLVVWGRHDRLVPLRHARDAASRLPCAELAVIPGAGHAPQLEQPDATAAALQQFFAGVRGASR